MTAGWTDADLHARDPLRRVAERIGCSTGQAWTLSGGLVLGVALLAASVLRGPGVAQEAAGGLALPPLLAPLPAAAPLPAPLPAPAPSDDPALPAPLVAPLPVPDQPGEALPAPDVAGPAPQPAEPSPASPAPSPTAAAAGPLRILAGGWTAADSTRGSARGFPDTDYPVSRDALGESRHSFVRLTGGGLRLVLQVDPAAGGTVGTPRLQACPTRTAAWRPGPEQPTAPPYADSPCAPGVPSADGARWTFDLSALPDPGSAAGVSLVPAPSDPTASLAPFQIAFLPAPGATP